MMKLKCIADWTMGGKLICEAGKSYLVDYLKGDDEGYCDVYGEADQKIWATHLDVGEHFED